VSNSMRSKIAGVFSVALIALTLVTLGFSPGMAAPEHQGVQSMPGIEVVVRYDDRYNPYHVPPPEQTELGIQSADFAVNWNPTGTGRCFGTLSPWPQEAKDAFNYAVNIWASLLNSSQTIEVDACWRSDLGPGVLGSCGPTSFQSGFINAPVPNTWYPVALANALENTDLYSGPEIRSNLSSTYSWYFGTDGNAPPTQLDFVSVVLHELGHGLGFIGSMLVDNGSGSAECNGGVNGYGCWGMGSSYPFIYDRFAEDGNSTSLLATGTYPNPSTALGSALTGNVSGGVYFDGPNANAANGGARVKLYAPNPWVSGSSYSHLDESFNNTPNALMTWSFSPGESVHSPGPVTLGMFQDMSWSVSSNPPNAPTNPSPADGATGVSINADLSWTGGDPDPGDTVTYDVYFEANDSTPDNLICNDVATPTCDPGTLAYNTHYYWYVVATDNHSASTTGNTWDFTTVSAPSSLDCSSAVTVYDGGSYNGDTTGGPSNVNLYSCVSWNESGPEDVYVLTTSSTGDIVATLSNMTVDLDVFILSSCNENACQAYGDAEATYSNAPPGTYYIVVDGWLGAAGGYTLDVAANTGGGNVYLPIVLKSFTGSPSTFEGELINLINAERSSRGLGTLNQSSILMQVAEAHSQDMHDRDFFDHVNPDSLGPGERLTNAGYNWSAQGENIGCGQSTPQAIFDSWMSSAVHREIVLSVTYTEVGVGYVAGGTCVHYWTAAFARPR